MQTRQVFKVCQEGEKDMKELKFRATSVKGNCITYENKIVSRMVYFGLEDLDADLIVPSMTYITDKTIIMQYTGLKDRHGKEIYEGDIVKIKHPSDMKGIYEIVEDKGSIRFKAKGRLWYDYRAFEYSENGIEIIGNIYENPELLENNNGKERKEKDSASN